MTVLRPQRRIIGIGIGLSTAIGILEFGYHYLNFVTNATPIAFYIPLIEELTSAWGAGLLLLALVLPLVRRLRKSGGWITFSAHLGLLVAYSVVHTTWNWAARQFAFTIFGLGHYDYGIMPARYAMEFPMDTMVYVVFIALVTLFDHYRMSLDHKVRVAQLEAELNGLRLATLESQLQPHFLFNALNTISSVMYEDLPAADSMLASLADLLRRALRPIAQPEVPLRDELETLELYLAIMRARFADRLTIGIDVADDVRNAGVPQLLLQPLVENALLHGDPGPGIHATVTLRARHTDGHLVLEIEDNGPGLRGRPADAIENGIGLGNTARRLKHLYGDAQQLVLSTAPSGGLSVVVKIPFRQLTVAGTP